MSRAKWDAITNGGLHTTIRDNESNSMKVTLQADPEDIIRGAKAYHQSLLMDDSVPDLRFAAGAQVWLNQGRWEDLDDAEELAQRFDRVQGMMTDRKVVNLR